MACISFIANNLTRNSYSVTSAKNEMFNTPGDKSSVSVHWHWLRDHTGNTRHWHTGAHWGETCLHVYAIISLQKRAGSSSGVPGCFTCDDDPAG